MTKIVAVIAAEPSGDMQGAALVQALRVVCGDVKFVGVGGSHMEKAGVDLWVRTQAYSSIGPGAALLNFPSILCSYLDVRKRLLEVKPHLTIFIDSPAVGMRLSKVLQKHNLKTAYFFPPSAWTCSTKRIKSIHSRTDAVICAFKNNAELYKKLNLPVIFFGHPMADIQQNLLTKDEAKAKLGVKDKLLVLMPGSREQEVINILPSFLKTVRNIRHKYPQWEVIIPCATSALEKLISNIIGKDLQIRLLSGNSRLALNAADCALCASGTVTLEASLLDVPMVICYRFNWFDAIIGKILLFTRILQIEHIGLPNLVLSKRAVPELIQEEANPEKIASFLEPLMAGGPEYEKMREDLSQVREMLGQAGVLPKIALAVSRILEGDSVIEAQKWVLQRQ